MKQVNADHYQFQKYVGKKRFASYYNQIRFALEFTPATILEIGPGPGIVTDILRKQSVKVTTLDFADDVGADIVASVTDMPLQSKSFDVVMCCQVLEHLPYENFNTALKEISRVSRKGAVISLPHSSPYRRYLIPIPRIRTLDFTLSFDLFPREHEFDGEHYWEIGKIGYPLKRILNDIELHFTAVTAHRYPEQPYHHFFVCRH